MKDKIRQGFNDLGKGKDKFEGYMNGTAVYSNPMCPPGIIYMINDNFTIQHPLRKDGEPDMRYGINRMEKMFRDVIEK